LLSDTKKIVKWFVAYFIGKEKKYIAYVIYIVSYVG
jgi:hypothetical protein